MFFEALFYIPILLLSDSPSMDKCCNEYSKILYLSNLLGNLQSAREKMTLSFQSLSFIYFLIASIKKKYIRSVFYSNLSLYTYFSSLSLNPPNTASKVYTFLGKWTLYYQNLQQLLGHV